ncbi:MAG: proprotein convertase P-domain-containing protein [Myxococcales bacterium]
MPGARTTTARPSPAPARSPRPPSPPAPRTAAAASARFSVWAGGNGNSNGDNSNYDGYANSVYTIAVGALTSAGAQSYYSEPGANLAVCAPSNGGSDTGITTTDLVGSNGYNYTGLTGNLSSRDYTNDFGGTSSACPLVAGTIALLLESKPGLGWRDVKEILMKSATKVSASDSDWVTNAGGFNFNHKFGAGMINAAAAVALAQNWTNLPAVTSQTLARTSLGLGIPDNNASGATVLFDLSANANLRVEQVTVAVNITHASRGQLAINLVSPQGTVSRLAEKHADTGDNYAWTFMTVRNWGESSQGTWTLQVIDQASGTTGTLSSATLTVYGTSAAALNRRPTVTAGAIGGAELFAENALSLTGVVATDPESDPLTLAYQWQISTDGANFTDIAGATGATLAADATRAGKLVRCRIVPSDAGGAGATFATAARALNRRPTVVAASGSAYSYDSELFLLDRSGNFTRSAIINEFSQGNGGSKEWVEILFLKEADARGWTFADRNDTILTFSQNTLWSAVPAGTLLVIYYSTDKDTILPAEKTSLGTARTLVIRHNNSTYFSGTWPAFSNSSAELLALRTSAGTLVDGLSYNGETSQNPTLGTVAANQSAAYQSDTDAGADLAANWLTQSAASGVATPAAGNGGANTTFVATLASGAYDQPAVFTFGAASQTPAGLSIDPETGVVSGVITASPGVYAIVIERANGVETVSQTLRLLVTAADGSATIQSGATWSPLVATSLASLNVAGTLDTNGQALTVAGAITLSGGTVLNAGPGSITYGSLSGGTLPGTTTAVSAYAKWLATYPTLTGDAALRSADPDADGLNNLLEQALGTDPTSAASRAVLAPSVSANRLHLLVPVRAWPQLTYKVEASADLATWVSIWQSTGAANTNATVDVSDTQDIPAGGRRFLRLVVSEP